MYDVTPVWRYKNWQVKSLVTHRPAFCSRVFIYMEYLLTLIDVVYLCNKMLIRSYLFEIFDISGNFCNRFIL